MPAPKGRRAKVQLAPAPVVTAPAAASATEAVPVIPDGLVIPPDGRLEIILWMCQTGLGPGNAAAYFGRGLTGPKVGGYVKWAMRHNMWPPPGVKMAPRAARTECARVSAKMRADRLAAAQAEAAEPEARKRAGPVAVEAVDKKVRKRLVKIRDQVLDRLDELSLPGGDADAFRAFATGLRTLTDKFDGLEALDAQTNTRETMRARLARLKAVADGDEGDPESGEE
jgi:hypothetical protein